MAVSKNKVDPKQLTAKDFIAELTKKKSKSELEKNQRYLRSDQNQKNKCLGVRMKLIFEMAKKYGAMPTAEIKKVLQSPFYEVRMGAVSIMDFQARDKNITEEQKKTLFNLYLKNHSQINNWDLVDRSAPYVVGGYLDDKKRTPLYRLAKSKNIWERRTAIVSTYFFIRKNEINETFKIANLLVTDKQDLIQKAVGSWIREAGKRDEKLLINFLTKNAKKLSPTTFNYATENLTKAQKEKLAALRK